MSLAFTNLIQREAFILLEKKKKKIDDIFLFFSADYILTNERYFKHAFTFFTPLEYNLIKKYMSLKALKIYIKQNKIPTDDYHFWIDLMLEKRVKIVKLVNGNEDYIFNKGLEFGYEILLEGEYEKKVIYKKTEVHNVLYFKKLALNKNENLKSLMITHKLIEPILFKYAYTSRKDFEFINTNTNNIVTRLHKTHPNIYTCILLGHDPTLKILNSGFDEKLLIYLDDYFILEYLFAKFYKQEYKKIISILRNLTKKIDKIDRFVKENCYYGTEVAKFLGHIVSFINTQNDFFAIFYEDDIDYKSFDYFYDRIYKINHFIINKTDRIIYFMKYPFYRNNFGRNFDVLNYEKVDGVILDLFCKKRVDIQRFYREKFLSIDYSKLIMCKPLFRKKINVKYDQAFNDFNVYLTDTKLGLLYILAHLDKISKEKQEEIMVAALDKHGEAYDFFEQEMWNHTCFLNTLLHLFKKNYDTCLSAILKNEPMDLLFKRYFGYKKYFKQCVNHVIANKEISDIIDNFYLDPIFCKAAILQRNVETDFKLLYIRLNKEKEFLKNFVENVTFTEKSLLLFLLKNNEKDLAKILISKEPNLWLQDFISFCDDNCTIDDARFVCELKNKCKLQFDNIKPNSLYMNIALDRNMINKLKTDDEVIDFINIYSYYPPHIFYFFDRILQMCLKVDLLSKEKVIQLNFILKETFNDKTLLFTVKDKINSYLNTSPSKIILQHLDNLQGYFTEALLILSQSITFSTLANKILTKTQQNSDRDFINKTLTKTFYYYLSTDEEKILIFRLKKILKSFTLDKSDLEFCKAVLKIINNIDKIIASTEYFTLIPYLLNLVEDGFFTDELIEIFRVWALIEKDIVFGFKERLTKHINYSKVLVGILLSFEKLDPDFVINLVDEILSLKIPNFLAYAPVLQSFKKKFDIFIQFYKEMFLTTNFAFATKAFVNNYNGEIEDFLVESIFIHKRKIEVLDIFELVLKNKAYNIIYNKIYTIFYFLKFDALDTVRRKSQELWSFHFCKGMIFTIIKPLIQLLNYYKYEEECFNFCLDSLLEKYDEVFEKWIVGSLCELKKYEEEKEKILDKEIDLNEDFEDKLKLAHNKSEKKQDDKAKESEEDKTLDIESNNKNSNRVKKTNEHYENKKQILTVLFTTSSRYKLFYDQMYEFVCIYPLEDLIIILAKNNKYQSKVVSLIINNKIEYEKLLSNKSIINELYKKVKDNKILTYCSDEFKMQLITENINDTTFINNILKNVIPSKSWEDFLLTQGPNVSIPYLLNKVNDFGHLQLIFERVFSFCMNIDELIDDFYIDYVKKVSYKNVKDYGKLVILLSKCKAYARIESLDVKFYDDGVIIELLKLVVEEKVGAEIVMKLLPGNNVLKDYVKNMELELL